MAFSPEVVVGSLVGVVVGSLVTDSQKLPLPGGSYGGAAIGGVLGGIAGRALFGAEEAPQQSVAPAQPAAPAPQVVVVQQPAPPAQVIYRDRPAPVEETYEEAHEEHVHGIRQFGRPMIIGRRHDPRRRLVEAEFAVPRRGHQERVGRYVEEAPAPRRRLTLAEVERVARTGQRLLTQVDRMADAMADWEEPEAELIEARRPARAGLGRF